MDLNEWGTAVISCVPISSCTFVLDRARSEAFLQLEPVSESQRVGILVDRLSLGRLVAIGRISSWLIKLVKLF